MIDVLTDRGACQTAENPAAGHKQQYFHAKGRDVSGKNAVAKACSLGKQDDVNGI